ncbi:MAG: ATP-binding protein, partial [bacterium]
PRPVADRHHGTESIECDLITASGPRIPVLKTSVPISIRGSQFLLESVVDISERKQAELELHKTNQSLEKSMEELKHTREQTLSNARMNALSQMVSGIAHDFNNILMPILGLSDLLLQYPEETKNRGEVRKTLRIINSAAKDGSEIVRRLREFYKPSETPTTAPVDLVILVKKALELTAPAWKSKAQAEGRHITIRTRIAKVPPIPGNAVQLREVLTNLIINAVDAMPTGGTITIAMEKKGAAILISVTDTGVGMSPETCKQCLEPFFTSKGTHGSGLGLSLCHGIITRHFGKFKIRSKLGKGTTITISLPLKVRSASAKAPHAGSRGKLNILLAEDAHESLNLITRYLHLGGHTVETVTDGLKALQRMKSSKFDLLITDKAMPQMNGNALAKEAKKAYPDIVVIMLTGFGDFMQLTADEEANIDLVLRKPLTKKELIDAIASLFAK